MYHQLAATSASVGGSEMQPAETPPVVLQGALPEGGHPYMGSMASLLHLCVFTVSVFLLQRSNCQHNLFLWQMILHHLWLVFEFSRWCDAAAASNSFD